MKANLERNNSQESTMKNKGGKIATMNNTITEESEIAILWFILLALFGRDTKLTYIINLSSLDIRC